MYDCCVLHCTVLYRVRFRGLQGVESGGYKGERLDSGGHRGWNEGGRARGIGIKGGRGGEFRGAQGVESGVHGWVFWVPAGESCSCR